MQLLPPLYSQKQRELPEIAQGHTAVTMQLSQAF